MARTHGRITSSKALLLSSSHLIFQEQGGHALLLHHATFAINAVTAPAKVTGQCTLAFGWELVLYESSMVGSGA